MRLPAGSVADAASNPAYSSPRLGAPLWELTSPHRASTAKTLKLTLYNFGMERYVFHVQPKHPNGAIFVNIEGLRPCLSKSSYGAPQWALVVRLMQKGRLKSPH